MRITDNILFNNFLFNINKINERVFINNEKMASGKRLLNLDSDPIALSKVLSLKDINARFDQYITNINSANAVLDAEDTALSNADNLLHKAGTLLVEGANTINNDVASRTAIAENLDAIKEELVDSANTIFQGKYLFSGSKTDTKPIQNVQNEASVINLTKSDNIADIKIAAGESFADINGLESGNYQVKIDGGKLYVCKGDCSDPNNIVPIDADSSDESDVGGNNLSDYIDLTNKRVYEKILNGDWIDTGRGLRIKIELNSPNVDLSNINANVSVYYKSGGQDIYMGDNGERNIEYSDKLTSPINVTAKQVFKPTNQTLENDNHLIDDTTNDPVTLSSKLTNIDLDPTLAEAIKKAAASTGYKLDTGDEIKIEGTDHNGNVVKGEFNVTSTATIENLTSYIKSLDSVEILDTNKTFTTFEGQPVTSATKLSDINDPNIQDAIGSTLTIAGYDHDGNQVSFAISINQNTTLSSIATSISSHFNVTASVQHGKIVIEDNESGPSKLSIQAFTENSKVPIFGSFVEKSHGGSGGFKDIDAYVKDGHIYFVDKRPSTSKFNLSFSVTTENGDIKPNIFGVFNVDKLGQGIDAFRTLRDASYALKNPHSLNQIGKPSPWQDISTFKVQLSGKYLGDKDETWTVKVAKVGNTSNTNFNSINESQIETLANSLSNNQTKTAGMFEVTNEEGNVVAVVGLSIGKTSSGNYYYEIKTVTPNNPDEQIDFSKIDSIDQIQGTTIYDVKNTSPTSASDLADKLINGLKDIVIQTRDANEGDFEGTINGVPGVKLSLIPPNITGAPAILEQGDSFSVKLSNKVEQALGKVKKALDQVLASRSIIGARTNRFQLAKSRVNYIKLSNSKTISELEDANIADVFTEFKRNQIVMQATLAVGARLTSQNLFDYLT